MYDDEKFQNLLEDIKIIKEDNIIIKQDNREIKQVIAAVPQISNDLKSISQSLESLEKSINIFVTYLTSNSKYLFWGIFIIILLAMGVKEIPPFFN